MRAPSLIGYLLPILFLLAGILWFFLAPREDKKATEPLGSLQMPKEIKASEIEDKAGAELPLDIEMTDQDGRLVKLSEYFKSEDTRPVILNLLYLGCPMLCSVVQQGLVKGLQGLDFKAGKDFRIISASIDHREKPELAKKKQATFKQALSLLDESAWTVHVMTEAEAKRLGDAVGFNYMFDKKTNQFAHGAGIFVVSPSGKLARTLFGIEFKPSDLKLALSEAASGKIGSFVDRILLSCFHYDPDSHRYGVYVVGVMRLGGLLTIAILGLVLLMYFRGERKSIKSIV